MVLGLLIVTAGFTFMALDNEKFGFMGITLSPIIVVAGFIVEIVAILYTPKEEK